MREMEQKKKHYSGHAKKWDTFLTFFGGGGSPKSSKIPTVFRTLPNVFSYISLANINEQDGTELGQAQLQLGIRSI